MEYFNQLDPLLRTFWYVAVPVSLIFLTQTIMTLLGASHGDSGDMDFDSHDHNGGGSDFHLFSFRNLINFLLGFGWAGVTLYSVIHSSYLLIAVALLVGAFFVWLFFLLIKQLQRLTEDNTFQLTDTLHQTAEVYLKIPANRSGLGKVHVSVKGAVHELDAMTDGPEISYGTKTLVTSIEGNILIIQPTSN